MKNETRRRIRFVSWILFVLYIVLLIYCLFLSEGYGRKEFSLREYRYNLELFKEIRRFWMYREKVGQWAAFLNIGGNIIGFVPFGFFLPLLQHKVRKCWKTGTLGFLLSLCIETCQFCWKVGSFDVDDLLLNTIGVLIGYLVFGVCNKIRSVVYEKKI
ncbi:MAG: VanZ family protein [Ruminococcus sp.]|nr:VanZ family protein [Ruminococcus sp.]